jgi:L-ascorbate metabolism protein UlaG (beta-lactamase superfamily)
MAIRAILVFEPISHNPGIEHTEIAMKITQIRNATILIEFKSRDGTEADIGLLVDPMLAARGALPTLKYLVGQRRRNPLVDLPARVPELLGRVTHALVTHCQRGHFDHLDRAGVRFLRESRVPVFCMPRDADWLRARGLEVRSLQAPTCGKRPQPFFHGNVTPIPCVHGRGLVGKLMEHGHGQLIALPGEPSVYIAGDTVLTDDVRACLSALQPDVAVLPAGGARFDFGGDILMDGDDMLAACRLTRGRVVANHLEALDHCPTSRAQLRDDARRAGLADRLLVPEDGETLEFQE